MVKTYFDKLSFRIFWIDCLSSVEIR